MALGFGSLFLSLLGVVDSGEIRDTQKKIGGISWGGGLELEVGIIES